MALDALVAADPRAVVGLAAVLAAGSGITADMALAASDSDFTAVSIALVALLIARSALVIVLAESVAWVAAVFSLAAAVVTLVAAADTARGVAGPVAVPVARRVVFAAAVAVRVRVPDVLAPVVGVLVGGCVAVFSVGTDLPPLRPVMGDLIPRCAMFYTWQ
jgi:hypothetical protein